MNTMPNVPNDSALRNQVSSSSSNQHQQSVHKPNRDIIYFQNEQKPITSDIRLINLESRVETLEKMLHFYEELLKLKEEEKNNNVQLDSHKIEDLATKVNQLEFNMSSLNKKINAQYGIIIEKIEGIQQEKLNYNRQSHMASIEDDQMINSSIASTVKHNEYITNPIEELEEIINTTKMINNELTKNKLESIQAQFDEKITDILSVIQDLNRITESNEYTVAELKETIQIMQNDNANIMKMVANLNDQGKKIDYILEEINDLKSNHIQLVHFVKINWKKDSNDYKDYLFDS